METNTLTHDSPTNRAQPLHEAADEEDLLSLFDQYYNLISANLDWLSTDDSIIINEVSVEGISEAYHVTVQLTTTALFNTGANMWVTSQFFFQLSTSQTKTAKIKYM